MHHDLYQSITDRIVAAVEAGTPPWVKPWSVSGDLRPMNAATRRPYRGINNLLLGLEADLRGYTHSGWLTFRQALAAGGHVRKGEAGTCVILYKLHEVDTERVGEDRKVIPFLRSFTVFNIAQIDGLALTEPPQPVAWDAQDAAETLLGSAGATIRHGGRQAYYERSSDCIQLPDRPAFAEAGDYYATALHELVHWTGHPSRCNRDLKHRFGDAGYAMEELVAELGSAFLCAHCRIDGQLQHAAYVHAWLPVLKSDKRAIFTAAAKAQAAADFVLQPEQIEVAA